MKLRNKETGEIVEAKSCDSVTGMFCIYYEEYGGQVGTRNCFETLAELNEEWEDYKPAEPLIKDKKTRKAVRAWAKANELRYFRVCKQHFNTFSISGKKSKYSAIDLSIEFFGSIECSEKITYEIEQLCGEVKK